MRLQNTNTVNTRRCFDVDSTFFLNVIDVRWMLCTYWEIKEHTSIFLRDKTKQDQEFSNLSTYDL